MDNDELLVAAQVRDLAVKIRGDKWATVFNEAGFSGATKESRDEADEFREAWFKDNPIETYIPDAYKRIFDVAVQIKALR